MPLVLVFTDTDLVSRSIILKGANEDVYCNKTQFIFRIYTLRSVPILIRKLGHAVRICFIVINKLLTRNTNLC